MHLSRQRAVPRLARRRATTVSALASNLSTLLGPPAQPPRDRPSGLRLATRQDVRVGINFNQVPQPKQKNGPRDQVPCQPERPQACKRADQRPSGGVAVRWEGESRGQRARPEGPGHVSPVRPSGLALEEPGNGHRDRDSRPACQPDGHEARGVLPSGTREGIPAFRARSDLAMAARAGNAIARRQAMASMDSGRSSIRTAPAPWSARSAGGTPAAPARAATIRRSPARAGDSSGVVAKLIQGTLVWAGGGHPLREGDAAGRQESRKRPRAPPGTQWH